MLGQWSAYLPGRRVLVPSGPAAAKRPTQPEFHRKRRHDILRGPDDHQQPAVHPGGNAHIPTIVHPDRNYQYLYTWGHNLLHDGWNLPDWERRGDLSARNDIHRTYCRLPRRDSVGDGQQGRDGF